MPLHVVEQSLGTDHPRCPAVVDDGRQRLPGVRLGPIAGLFKLRIATLKCWSQRNEARSSSSRRARASARIALSSSASNAIRRYASRRRAFRLGSTSRFLQPPSNWSNITCRVEPAPNKPSVCAEMRVHGIDDRLQPPTRLFAFVAVRRHVTQGAPDRLPVTFQQIGCSEG